MIRIIASILLCAFACQAITNSPGKVVLWTTDDSVSSKDTYITKTITSDHVKDFVEENVMNFEVLAILKTDKDFLVSNPTLLNSVTHGHSKTVFNYVYQPAKSTSTAATRDSLLSSPVLQDAEILSLAAFNEKLADTSANGPLNDKKLNVFEVSVGENELVSLKDRADLRGQKVLFVAVSEPALDSFVPAAQAKFNRLLSSTQSSDTIDGLYYKPEGAEYSIYYADTYLYLTPDIFTGLMTGIFFFFVLLIGISCLGSIQGMSMFYDKSPPVGKEA